MWGWGWGKLWEIGFQFSFNISERVREGGGGIKKTHMFVVHTVTVDDEGKCLSVYLSVFRVRQGSRPHVCLLPSRPAGPQVESKESWTD